MAECIENQVDSLPDWEKFKENLAEQINEIEALKSSYEDTDNLDILEEASESDKKKYSVQLRIPIETNKRPIKVEVWLPIEQADFESNQRSIEKDANIPVLERSISGKRAHTNIDCERLIPIQVDIVLPDSYPSENKPIFTIVSEWLNRSQLSQLSLKLNQIWEENSGLPILYTWFDWIKSNLIAYLDMFEPPNRIILTPLNSTGELDLGSDHSIQSRFLNTDELILNLLRHNYIEELKEFRNSLQNCMICFDEKMGREFIRLNDCKHHFCLECMSRMCTMHVKEGTIQLLKCPNTECEAFVTIDVMFQVLSADEFERWERLLFQKTLDSMEDVIYCPKCSNPIVVDNADNHAFCMICKSDYCKLCKDVWHSGKCSSNEEKIAERVKNLRLTVKDLMVMTEDEIRKRFKDSEYVLKLKQKSIENGNDEAIKRFLQKYVRCPRCKAPIEKIDGCNKIICICNCILCYECGMKIDGYDHFTNNGKCNLFTPQEKFVYREPPRHEGQVRIERVINLMPEERRNCVNCITCGQRNLKVERNNHIKCWLCKTNFCFECRKKIVGNISAHFIGSKCKQHSE